MIESFLGAVFGVAVMGLIAYTYAAHVIAPKVTKAIGVRIPTEIPGGFSDGVAMGARHAVDMLHAGGPPTISMSPTLAAALNHYVAAREQTLTDPGASSSAHLEIATSTLLEVVWLGTQLAPMSTHIDRPNLMPSGVPED